MGNKNSGNEDPKNAIDWKSLSNYENFEEGIKFLRKKKSLKKISPKLNKYTLPFFNLFFFLFFTPQSNTYNLKIRGIKKI